MTFDASTPATGVSLPVESPSTQIKVQAGCVRCEAVTPPPAGPGWLHFRFPLSHTLGKVRAVLKEQSWKYTENNGALSIRVDGTDLSSFLRPFSEALSAREQDDVRVLLQRDGQTLQPTDYFEVDSLRTFAAKAQSGWLRDLIDGEHLTNWFQPILNCADTSQIFAYECLMRGQDGDRLVFPNEILNVARGADLLFQLDRAARVTAIKNAARFGLNTKIFINFTPTSIYDPKNCLQTTLKAVDESRLSREQVVFEVIESENVDDPAHLRNILDYYRERNFKVALDDIGSGYSSLNMISHLRPDFIKLDRELISGVAADPFKALLAQKLLEAARGLNILTVAEGVETEAEYSWLCEHGANYVQGYYFAKPASPPPLLERAVAARV